MIATLNRSRKTRPMSFTGSGAVSTPTRADLLFIEADSVIEKFAPMLSEGYRFNSTSHAKVALEYIKRTSPSLIVTELQVDGGSGIDICMTAKMLATPSTVLVTTNDHDLVPDAIAAGCDGVLLKPYESSLLLTRIGRLKRERAMQLRLRAARTMSKAMHLSERVELMTAGTNRTWPNTHCPYCDHEGVTSFDYASLRRAWYACLQCKKVWLAKRQD